MTLHVLHSLSQIKQLTQLLCQGDAVLLIDHAVTQRATALTALDEKCTVYVLEADLNRAGVRTAEVQAPLETCNYSTWVDLNITHHQTVVWL